MSLLPLCETSRALYQLEALTSMLIKFKYAHRYDHFQVKQIKKEFLIWRGGKGIMISNRNIEKKGIVLKHVDVSEYEV